MTETATTYRELRRSRSDRMLAGVCGGLGRYFNVNPVFYRVAFAVLTLIGGAGILIYGACLLVIPNDGETDSIASDALRNHRQRPVALVALGLVAVAGIALLSHISFHIHSDGFWIVVLIVGALMLGAQRREHRSTSTDLVPDSGTSTTTTTATTAAAAPPRRHRNPFLWALAGIGLLFASAVIAVVAYGVSYLHLGDGVGNRSYAPHATSQLHDYRLGVGEMKIDLGNLDVTEPTTVHAHLGMGELRVIVPNGVKVKVDGHVTWGDIDALGNDENGHNVDSVLGAADPQLTIDAHVDAGQITVLRALR